MRNQNLELTQQVISQLLKGKITKKQAQEQLGCHRSSLYRYLDKAAQEGLYQTNSSLQLLGRN